MKSVGAVQCFVLVLGFLHRAVWASPSPAEAPTVAPTSAPSSAPTSAATSGNEGGGPVDVNTTSSTTTAASNNSTTPSANESTASTTSSGNVITTTAAATNSANNSTANTTNDTTTTGKATGSVTTSTATTTADASPITSFKSKLGLNSASEFNEEQYLQSVAQAAGVDLSAVEVTSLVYVVAVQYSVPSGISETDFAASVASTVGVTADKVAVTFSGARRLVGGSRRLQNVIADVEISTEDSAATSTLSTKANDASALASSLEAVTGGPVTLTVSKVPSLSVIVETQVRSSTATPVQAPSASDIASSLTAITGKDITVDVIDVQVGTVTNTTTVGDSEPEASKSVKTFSTGSLGSIVFLLLAACTAMQ